MKSVTEARDLKGKRVLVRVDWSIPSETDDFQIKKSLPTLEYLVKEGVKVIIITHAEGVPIDSLRKFVPEGAELLGDLRDDPREEANTESLARELADKADVYVNEAFSVSHRRHASIVGIPKFLPHYAGLRFLEEVEGLSKALNPLRPFLLILGGAKFETKLPLVEKLLTKADEIFVAGAMAKPALEAGLAKNGKIILSLGDIAAPDADEENLNLLKERIERASLVVWSGPLGKYEEGYKDGTIKLAQMLVRSGKEVIVGGADTIAVIRELDILDKFSFVSTGGGAMLEFLATGTLPGIEALNNWQQQ